VTLCRPLSALSITHDSTRATARPPARPCSLHPSPATSRHMSMFLAAASPFKGLSSLMPPSSTTSGAMLSPAQVSVQPLRTRILYSKDGGKSETVMDVVQRFFRLHNGLWIRTKAGRDKKKWAKAPGRLHRLKQHVVCNRSQCQLLDRMVNKEYRMPKLYVEDVYTPYHRKSNLPDYRYQPPKFLPWNGWLSDKLLEARLNTRWNVQEETNFLFWWLVRNAQMHWKMWKLYTVTCDTYMWKYTLDHRKMVNVRFGKSTQNLIWKKVLVFFV